MTSRNNMLVQVVRERRGGVLQPVGVMVGINDIADGIGCVRTGWSRCHLPPVHAPATIPDEYLSLMKPEGIRKYHAAHKAHENAVKNSDKFNKERGIAQAIQNMLTFPPVPSGRGFGRKYARFQGRCNNYFQDAQFFIDNGKTTRIPRLPRTPKNEVKGEDVLKDLLGIDLFNSFVKTNPALMAGLPMASLPPGIRRLAQMLEQVVGPVKIVGLTKF